MRYWFVKLPRRTELYMEVNNYSYCTTPIVELAEGEIMIWWRRFHLIFAKTKDTSRDTDNPSCGKHGCAAHPSRD